VPFIPSKNCGYGSTGEKFCCSNHTTTVRGVRSDSSEANGFASLSGSTLILADFKKRNFLPGEEFVQEIKIEVKLTNAEGASAIKLASITIYNEIHYCIVSSVTSMNFSPSVPSTQTISVGITS
jgi:hypothetical protein